MFNQNWRLTLTFIALLPLAFAACDKEPCHVSRTFTLYTPVFLTKQDARASITSGAPRAIEHPGKIYVKDKYIFLNEIDQGVHVIDNTNPASPVNVSFINIPGNVDIAARGNTLYADTYTDMAVIDISNPVSVVAKKFVDNLFPNRSYGATGSTTANGDSVIGYWQTRDTTIELSCGTDPFHLNQTSGVIIEAPIMSFANSETNASLSTGNGTGGSTARMTLVDGHLYTINTESLNVFDVANASDPSHLGELPIGWGIETIYPFRDKLFIGSTNGMYMYAIGNNGIPTAAAAISHIGACDPVVADDEFAYVTLHSGSACNGFANQLEVIRLNSLSDMTREKIYDMTDPHGLAKDGSLLLICDGRSGLRILQASNVLDIQEIRRIEGFEPFDVITQNKIALIIAKDGLYQYDYSNPMFPILLSKIPLG